MQLMSNTLFTDKNRAEGNPSMTTIQQRTEQYRQQYTEWCLHHGIMGSWRHEIIAPRDHGIWDHRIMGTRDHGVMGTRDHGTVASWCKNPNTVVKEKYLASKSISGLYHFVRLLPTILLIQYATATELYPR